MRKSILALGKALNAKEQKEIKGGDEVKLKGPPLTGCDPKDCGGRPCSYNENGDIICSVVDQVAYVYQGGKLTSIHPSYS